MHAILSIRPIDPRFAALAFAAGGLAGCASLDGLWALCEYQPAPVVGIEDAGALSEIPAAEASQEQTAP